VRKGDLFELYQAWCHQTGSYEMAERAFSKELAAKRFKDKHSNGAWWIGVQPTVALQDIKDGVWTAADEQQVEQDARQRAASDDASLRKVPGDDWD
jgi:phage/plasmid-associated DNA primase